MMGESSGESDFSKDLGEVLGTFQSLQVSKKTWFTIPEVDYPPGTLR